MSDTRREQIGAATGIVAMLLLVVSFFTAPQPPMTGASGSEILSYYRQNGDGALLGTYLGLASLIFLLWFAGTLLAHLRAGEGGTGRVSVISFSGAIGGITTFVASAGFGAILPRSANDLSPELAQVLYEAQLGLGNAGFFVFLVWIFGASLVVVRTGALPVWIGWAGVVLSVIGAISTLGFFVETVEEFFMGPLGLVVFLGFSLWVLAMAITLVMRIGSQAKAPSMSSS